MEDDDKIKIELCFCGNCGKELIEIPYNKDFDDIVQKDLKRYYKNLCESMVDECIMLMEEYYKNKHKEE